MILVYRSVGLGRLWLVMLCWWVFVAFIVACVVVLIGCVCCVIGVAGMLWIWWLLGLCFWLGGFDLRLLQVWVAWLVVIAVVVGFGVAVDGVIAWCEWWFC